MPSRDEFLEVRLYDNANETFVKDYSHLNTIDEIIQELKP